MNKRLRKKKHVKEFIEYGLEVEFKINPSKIEVDEFVDKFIDQVESIKCFCGGLTGVEGGCRFTIEVGQKPTAQLNSKTMIDWLKEQEKTGLLTIEKYGEYLINLWEDKPTKIKAY